MDLGWFGYVLGEEERHVGLGSKGSVCVLGRVCDIVIFIGDVVIEILLENIVFYVNIER